MKSAQRFRGSTFGVAQPLASVVLAAVVLLGAVLTAAPATQAQTFSVLYTFDGADGAQPYAGLIQDANGNFYGTTTRGGPRGGGTVFKLDTTGKETVLFGFSVRHTGGIPEAAVIRDSKGNLYGTTTAAGAPQVVFKLTNEGRFSWLHKFHGGDGHFPGYGSLLLHAGKLYGTTVGGGTHDQGVVFKCCMKGKDTLLYVFTGGADGGSPAAGLILDAAGSLYGTTEFGGDLNSCSGGGCGSVFRLDSGGIETVLYGFTGGADGKAPLAGVTQDAAGNLYGTTVQGGEPDKGTVFKLDPGDSETALYSFSGGTDGGLPRSALVQDSAGNLYGTTEAGGNLKCGDGNGCGVVFKVDTSGNETVLYSFTGGADGAYPYAGLLLDAAGILYGTTTQGGSTNCNGGCGVLFKIAP